MTPPTVETLDEIKARGAFYTPDHLTRLLAGWAVRSGSDHVLEPSCGDGAFVTALVQRFRELTGQAPSNQLVGIERDPAEADKARSLAPAADIRALDFFDLDPLAVPAMDSVVGNPPYIRYHGFTGSDRDRALLRALAQGVELNRLASSWAHFVVHAGAFLKADGRLGLVLPAELLHTDYGQPVRDYLLRRFSSVIVIAFDGMVFPNAQVDAVLLLASSDDDLGLRVVRVRDADSLLGLDLVARGPANGHADPRWSAAVDTEAGDIYQVAVRRYESQRLGPIASVDIGFVTGADDFFVLSAAEARARGIAGDFLTAAVRRPRDVPGINVRPGEVSWLLDLAGRSDLPDQVSAYLAKGASLGVPGRYKCRVRKSWYAVPIPRQQPDAFIPYMAHLGPRLIVNEVGARSSNLLHGVAFRPGAPSPRAMAVAMCSSLTLLSAEIEGRAYGGGVLKLETREAERLVVPVVDGANSGTLEGMFDEVDLMMRRGDVKAAAQAADTVLRLDHESLWSAYGTFRDRRLNRRRA